MSRSISEPLRPEGRSGSFRSACWNCCRRKDCPYSCDRALERSLHCAAEREKDAARRLTAEAKRLFEKVSCANCDGQLLSADEAVEHALSNALYGEIALIESLSALRRC